ncbi:sensor histidine kinase [Zeaxanthinibacter enoshimensis]|uniref:histidine kinase n=1 Tax=Zeaxanthinibacter enoshimensis TaxID=392009 RepID=A0A4V3D450_9FLAO|nr:ATP-binding protein [Zeaxanthinibacter enoshimensis]TDQ32991.1 phospho-acceptor domain-containing protein [Zeaxanthinibacter enoshimensis]
MNELESYKKKLSVAEEKVKILEKMIEDRTRELYTSNQDLQRKNQDLEQFSYIASHDLQEPLRTISSFSDLFLHRYKGQLDENADKYMSIISNSALRMRALVKNLMDYNRIGLTQARTEVNCETVVREVESDLADIIYKTGATLDIGELPVINGYEMEIRLLFQNLVSNALKFHKSRKKPKVEISATRESVCWKFAVKDNGIGIDPVHQEKIFLVFQRLHNRSVYEGTGIGLAHCKKIVDLHQGEIWVESTLGQGSTFYFTIMDPKTL